MDYTTSVPWAESFITAANVERARYRSSFYRSVRAGRFVRLAPGIFMPIDVWRQLGNDDRYIARVHASSLGRSSTAPYSHVSAAALWHLPNPSPWPPIAHAYAESFNGGRSRTTLTAHPLAQPEAIDTIDGLPVTTVARTVVDVARTELLSTAVAMADFSLATPARGSFGVDAVKTTRIQLQSELDTHPSLRGRKKCELVLTLADGDSGSPGESVSRVGFFVLGFPAPILQHEFRDSEGVMIVDFWWPEYNLVGEFDGLGKYLRNEMTRGRTTAEVVIDEKRREDRIRALGPKVTRWGWPVARSLPLLDAQLRRAGLQ